jgi:large subunit ribosomal protein L6
MVEKKIVVQDNVTIEVDKLRVKVKGPKGELEKDFDNPIFNGVITIEKNNEIIVKSSNDNRKILAMVGTICSHIKNMELGVTVGFRYKMKIFYSHFPMAVSVKDGIVEVKNFLGEKGARTAKVAGSSNVSVKKDEILVEGINLEDIGQTCANIERACKIGRKDRRVYQDGIYLSEKLLQNGEKL